MFYQYHTPENEAFTMVSTLNRKSLAGHLVACLGMCAMDKNTWFGQLNPNNTYDSDLGLKIDNDPW